MSEQEVSGDTFEEVSGDTFEEVSGDTFEEVSGDTKRIAILLSFSVALQYLLVVCHIFPAAAGYLQYRDWSILQTRANRVSARGRLFVHIGFLLDVQ